MQPPQLMDYKYNMGIIDLAMSLDSGYLFQVLRFSSLGIWGCA